MWTFNDYDDERRKQEREKGKDRETHDEDDDDDGDVDNGNKRTQKANYFLPHPLGCSFSLCLLKADCWIVGWLAAESKQNTTENFFMVKIIEFLSQQGQHSSSQRCTAFFALYNDIIKCSE